MNHELRIKGILINLILLGFIFLLTAGSISVLASEEEIVQGQEIWQKLSTDQVKCENLSDGELESLGEFFMERMAGSTANHEVMDKQMEQRMGKENLEKMHIVMGKRMSGCDVGATLNGWDGMMGFGMMGMMKNLSQKGGEQNMMGPGMMSWGQGGMMSQAGGNFWIWSILSWLTWILVVVALIAFIRWMWKEGDKKSK